MKYSTFVFVVATAVFLSACSSAESQISSVGCDDVQAVKEFASDADTMEGLKKRGRMLHEKCSGELTYKAERRLDRIFVKRSKEL